MPRDLLKALDALPDTLDETYKRILDGIPQIHLQNSIRILQFLTYAERPINIREVVDILATTPENDPKFDPGNRMPSPQGVLKFCSSLVTISSEEIQLAHFSVKEYLASPGGKGLFESNLHELCAQQSITRVLLAYLSSLKDWKDWYEDLRRMIRLFPLAAYGGTYWMKHAKKTGKSRETQELILDFFKHRDALFICTGQIFNPDISHGEPRNNNPHKALLPLYLASMGGWEHTVEGLLNQDPDSIDEFGSGIYGSALRVACHYHQIDIVRILLERGADVNLVSGTSDDDDYGTALMTALIGDHYDLLEVLFEYDADPNVQVAYAVYEIFPEHGDNQTSIYGVDTYPLICASLCGFEGSVRILLDKGALPNKTDEWGNSALYYACWRGHYKIVDLLLSHMANIDGLNPLGATPFYAACESGCNEVIRLLLERSQIVNAGILISGGKCGSALQTASFWGRLDAVKLLCSYGADPNQSEGDYGPALHAASSRGHLRVVELLLDNGADPNVLDCHQWTALLIAIKNGHDDVSQALRPVSGSGPLLRCCHPSTFIKLDKDQDIEINISKQTLEGGIQPREALVYVTRLITLQSPQPRGAITMLYPTTLSSQQHGIYTSKSKFFQGRRYGKKINPTCTTQY